MAARAVTPEGVAPARPVLVIVDADHQARAATESALLRRFGAEPRTDWLRAVLARDDGGFILTGRDVPAGAWPLERPPLAFETSLPGVFAVGDVRHGSIKRVAEAVGEGSVAVGSVHRYLADGAARLAPRP
jgi:thioredoxin reductase (NADPH)